MSDNEMTLTIEQQRRAEAVKMAAASLRRINGIASSIPGCAEDIERLANFILSAEASPETETETETKYDGDEACDSVNECGPYTKPGNATVNEELNEEATFSWSYEPTVLPKVRFNSNIQKSICDLLGIDYSLVTEICMTRDELEVTYVPRHPRLRETAKEYTVVYTLQ